MSAGSSMVATFEVQTVHGRYLWDMKLRFAATGNPEKKKPVE
jgi:hypothetical protein